MNCVKLNGQNFLFSTRQTSAEMLGQPDKRLLLAKGVGGCNDISSDWLIYEAV